MNKTLASLLLLLLPVLSLSAQWRRTPEFSHFVKAHYIYAPNKQIYLGSYEFGYRRIVFSFGVGKASGYDNQYVSPDQVDNDDAKAEISASSVIDPKPIPRNAYAERCESNYSGLQYRLGFTVFLRKNDTLTRRAFSGPHAGVNAIFMRTKEDQTLTYKANTSDTRYVFSAMNNIPVVGAATHVGWQFALLNEKLYIDTRAVLPFYYPFMVEPNLNSPFAGNKWEAQVSIGWRFTKPKKEVKNDDGAKVRKTI